MTTDAYKEAKAISDSLRGAGFVVYADQMSSAVSEGSTGTEIYMILRWRLTSIIEDGILPVDIKVKALSLHRYLNDVLEA